jgi:hypothetical protein
MNGDSKGKNERASSLVSSFDLSCRYKRFLFSLGCSNWPSTKYLLLKVSDNSIADALKYVCIIIRMFHLHINAKILLFSISMLSLWKLLYVHTYREIVCAQLWYLNTAQTFTDSGSLFFKIFSRFRFTLFQTGSLFPASGFTLSQTLSSLFSRLWVDSFPDSELTLFQTLVQSFSRLWFYPFSDSKLLFNLSRFLFTLFKTSSLFCRLWFTLSEWSSLFSRPSSLFSRHMFIFPRLCFTLFPDLGSPFSRLLFTLFQTLVHLDTQTLVHPFLDSASLSSELWFTLSFSRLWPASEAVTAETLQVLQ